ncbi:transcription initiation factor TFIID subunit 7 [Amaranthus tricolor]|uniref:transcription initiation factor TFIID subunit 7 n=1 Tax=Amaranthus tricolor TaxID=29722 RepID=UPI00258AFFA2|nr:transcription initiation factor TFIID subunit 7 [Amaranthus tricolor]
MEIEASDGSKILLKPNSTTIFGRGNGFSSNDLSVSRRHISFEFIPSSDPETTPTVSFEVLGKNPVWVCLKQQENGENIKSFKRLQRGKLGFDDMFCVSAKTPIWYTLNKSEEVDEEIDRKSEEPEERINSELSQSLETASGFEGIQDFALENVDVSGIDPVQEFGFLVIGHEFDQYPKQMIRDIKKWDWFLEDPREDTDDEDPKKKGSTSSRKRKKTSRGNDDADEEWTAESEGEELTTTPKKAQRPKYHTRSKEHGVQKKGRINKKSSAETSRREEEEEESEDEEDETLGGFIVDDDTAAEDEVNEIDEDEEEEFIEDDELED